MKPTSILLASVVVLGLASDARAYSSWINCNRSIEVGKYRFGFADWSPGSWGEPTPNWTMMYAGPFGEWQVPFSATQGLTGCCIILATLIIVPVVLTLRWKKKRG